MFLSLLKQEISCITSVIFITLTNTSSIIFRTHIFAVTRNDISISFLIQFWIRLKLQMWITSVSSSATKWLDKEILSYRLSDSSTVCCVYSWSYVTIQKHVWYRLSHHYFNTYWRVITYSFCCVCLKSGNSGAVPYSPYLYLPQDKRNPLKIHARFLNVLQRLFEIYLDSFRDPNCRVSFPYFQVRLIKKVVGTNFQTNILDTFFTWGYRSHLII